MLFFKRANVVCDAKNLTGFSNVKQIVVFAIFMMNHNSQSHKARTEFTFNHCPKVGEETFYDFMNPFFFIQSLVSFFCVILMFLSNGFKKTE